MGVKGLYSYVRPYRREFFIEEHDSPPLRIGFDAMSLLYKYKSNFKELYPLLRTLKDKGHKLLFVFDGKPPVEKEAEVKERRETRAGAIAQATALREQLERGGLAKREKEILEFSVARLEFQGWHMTRDIRHEFQRELWDMEIAYVKGLGEADVVLVDMVAAGKLDVVVSTDMDYLLSSVPRLWIPFRKHRDGFEEVLLEDVLKGEGITAEGLRDAGILCGVEPMQGKIQFQPQKVFTWIRYYKGMEGLLASAVKDKQLDHFREEGALEAARAHFQPQTPWTVRIRPDHYERFRGFLETL